MNSIGFLPVAPWWMTWIWFLLILIFIFFEIKKQQKYLVARLLAIALVGLSVLGFLYRPYYQSNSTQELLLLTPGYSLNKLDSIINKNKNLTLVHTRECGRVMNSKLIDDEFFETQGANIKHILGEGLSPAHLETIKHPNFLFTPTEPMGITKLVIEEDVMVDERNEIKGVMNCNTDIQLRLIGPAGVEDSTVIQIGKNQSFRLSFHPKQRGRFLYGLEIRNGDSILVEPVPINVQARRPLKILFLLQHPTMETKGLKNFLGEKEHSVSLQYRLSKETYRREFINTPEAEIRVAANILGSFHLAFADAKTLNSLTPHEKIQLKAAIQAGLGVIVLASEEYTELQWFWPLQYKLNQKDTVHIRTEKHESYVLPVLPYNLTSEKEVYPVTASQSNILSGYFLEGHGKIGFQILLETYRLRVEGKEYEYAKLWNNLISHTSRSTSVDRVKILSAFPIYPREPIQVDVLSSSHIFFLDSVQIPLTEDYVIDDYWHTRLWADRVGWHTLQTKDATSTFYVANTNSWKSIKAANRMVETAKKSRGTSVKNPEAVAQNEVPPLFFAILFLIAMGFLWLVPKLG